MPNECECNLAVRQRTANNEMIVAVYQDAYGSMH